MNLPEFVAKWKNSTLTERSAAQSYFIDLCNVLGVPNPTDSDLEGGTYTFERGARKTGGGDGWADVWKKGHFAWEFKGKHGDLNRAYQQLHSYVADLKIRRCWWSAISTRSLFARISPTLQPRSTF